jgi:hypothetical protein
MRTLDQMPPEELSEAHGAAELLLSAKFRSCLPGRMLPMLVGRFRDDLAEALGTELPSSPRRPGPVKVAKLDDLTSAELDHLSDAVLALVARFTTVMDDPALPGLLRDFQEALVTETADRARIADELKDKATAS